MKKMQTEYKRLGREAEHARADHDAEEIGFSTGYREGLLFVYMALSGNTRAQSIIDLQGSK